MESSSPSKPLRLYDPRCYNLSSMEADSKNLLSAKISPHFRARLDGLGPKQKVRAIVLLTTPTGRAPTRREARTNRRAIVESVRPATQAALPDIDEILHRFDGRRLKESSDALGSIPVETTPAGVRALAASDHVKTILEDQPIFSLPTIKQA